MGVMTGYEQLSLFDLCTVPEEEATSCWNGAKIAARKLEGWMRRLVPDGEYVVDIGGHDCVLRPTKLSAADIPQGHEFYHYLIGQKLYAGIFVGRDASG